MAFHDGGGKARAVGVVIGDRVYLIADLNDGEGNDEKEGRQDHDHRDTMRKGAAFFGRGRLHRRATCVKAQLIGSKEKPNHCQAEGKN